MMVVATSAQERGLASQLRHQAKTQSVSVESDRLWDCGHFQVDVTHLRPRWKAVERLGGGIADLGQEILQVQRHRRHARCNLSLPDFSGTIPVDLNAMSVGIAEIERLADEMVRSTCELNSIASRMGEPAGEVCSFRYEQREVVQPGESDG